jgi:asparagine N-glycosylation enzyme membrane subunit Stt3
MDDSNNIKNELHKAEEELHKAEHEEHIAQESIRKAEEELHKVEEEEGISARYIFNFAKTRNGIIFFSLFIVIVMLTIYFRMPLYKYTGFYEPDGFYHFSVIRAAVSNHFIIPQYLSISGWPAHTPVSEPHGFYWVTLFPYAILQFFGISYYTVMRLVPVFFGILDVIGAYLLSRYLSKNKFFGLLVMLFVALSMGDAARTSATIYRGDGFITIFLILSLLFFVKTLRTGSKNKMLAYSLAAGFLLSFASLVWNGSPFATATYVFAFALVVIYGFIFSDSKLVGKSKYLLLGLGIWYILAKIYQAAGFIMGQTFTGNYFIVLYIFLVLGWLIARYVLSKQSRFSNIAGNAKKRFWLALGFLVIALLAIYIVLPGFVYQIFVGNGFIVTSSFAATIQELQPPSAGFLFASFGIYLFATPMSIIIYLSTFFAHPKYVFWIIMFLTFIPYFFMKVENDKKVKEGNAYLKFGISEMMMVLVAYYALTAYLQIHAVRFNSLLSVPLAIFSAYTIYWLILYSKKFNKNLIFVGYGILIAFIVYTLILDYSYMGALVQADGINPEFLSAMSWMKNNTPSNATVLTLWPDGSVVEGWANRTSVTDSVGSQNGTKADAFALWLFNSSTDPQFLLSNINGKPDYLLVRYQWMLETGGIFTESGLNSSLQSLYSFAAFTGISEQANKTLQEFTFTGSNNFEERTIIANVNNTQEVASYIIMSNGISPVTYVAFYNEYNSSYTVVKQTAYNTTNGDMLLVTYSPIANPKMPINITGAYLLSPGIANSNMIKFMYFCNNNLCMWNNKIAKLELVYSNPDSKIFKIIYNTTS